MGGIFGKGHNPEENYIPHGPEVDLMTRVYTASSCVHLPVWQTQFGFPKHGSFDPGEITKLEEGLLGQKQKLYQMDKITQPQREAMEQHQNAFTLWKRESEKKQQQEASKLQMVQKIEIKKKEKSKENLLKMLQARLILIILFHMLSLPVDLRRHG